MGAFTDRPHALSPPAPVDENDNLNRVVTRAWIDAVQTCLMENGEDSLALDDIPRRRGVALGDLLDAGESWEMADDGERNEWPVEAVPRRRARVPSREADRRRLAAEAEEDARQRAEVEAKAAARKNAERITREINARAAEAQREASEEGTRRLRAMIDAGVARWAQGDPGPRVVPPYNLRHYALNVLHGRGLTLDVGAVEKGEVTLREVASGARFAVPVEVVKAYRAGQPFPRPLLDRMLAARADAFKAQSGIEWWRW